MLCNNTFAHRVEWQLTSSSEPGSFAHLLSKLRLSCAEHILLLSRCDRLGFFVSRLRNRSASLDDCRLNSIFGVLLTEYRWLLFHRPQVSWSADDTLRFFQKNRPHAALFVIVSSYLHIFHRFKTICSYRKSFYFVSYHNLCFLLPWVEMEHIEPFYHWRILSQSRRRTDCHFQIIYISFLSHTGFK